MLSFTPRYRANKRCHQLTDMRMILVLLSCLNFESLPTSGLICSSSLLLLKEMTKATVICHQSLRSSFLLSPCRLSVFNLVVLGMVYSLVSIFILTVSVIPRSSIFSSLSCIACISEISLGFNAVIRPTMFLLGI